MVSVMIVMLKSLPEHFASASEVRLLSEVWVMPTRRLVRLCSVSCSSRIICFSIAAMRRA